MARTCRSCLQEACQAAGGASAPAVLGQAAVLARAAAFQLAACPVPAAVPWPPAASLPPGASRQRADRPPDSAWQNSQAASKTSTAARGAARTASAWLAPPRERAARSSSAAIAPCRARWTSSTRSGAAVPSTTLAPGSATAAAATARREEDALAPSDRPVRATRTAARERAANPSPSSREVAAGQSRKPAWKTANAVPAAAAATLAGERRSPHIIATTIVTPSAPTQNNTTLPVSVPATSRARRALTMGMPRARPT